jgi:hypothetical protein
MVAHHYHSEGVTDLAKIREDCRAQAAGRGIFDRSPDSSILHLHPKKVLPAGVPLIDPILFQCKGAVHEIYEIGKDEVLTLAVGNVLEGTIAQLQMSKQEYLVRKQSNA